MKANEATAETLAKNKSNGGNSNNNRRGKGNRRNNNKYKGNKYNNGGSKSKDPIDDTGLDAEGRSNDPNWYFSSPELASQAAQLSFQNFVGTGTVIDNYQLPSIMKIMLNPSPGITYNIVSTTSAPIAGTTSLLPGTSSPDDFTAGINIAATRIYNQLAKTSGRAQNYQPQDISMMILAISSLAEWSEHIRRTFGMLMITNERNRLLPTKLVQSVFGESATPLQSAQDMMSNIANYRMRFNVSMARINQIPLLDNIGFIRKSRDIYQHIYVDSASSMAQMFYYAPESVWVLDEKSDPNGSCLKTRWVVDRFNRHSYNDMGQYLDLLDEMITALLESSTLNLVYADMLNYANNNNLPTWKFDYLAENYTILPEYNRNALLQYHNLSTTNYPLYIENGYTTEDDFWFTSENDVYQNVNVNACVYNPCFASGSYMDNTAQGSVVDMDTMSPTLEDRIEALRFASTPMGWWKHLTAQTYDGATLTAAGNYNSFVALCDHYVVRLIIYCNNPDSAATETVKINNTRWISDTNTSGIMKVAGPLSQFEHHPICYIRTTSGTYPRVFGDLTYYTSVDALYMSRLMRIMNTGLFEFRI